MSVIQRDTEFAPTQPADIVRDERSTVERMRRTVCRGEACATLRDDELPPCRLCPRRMQQERFLRRSAVMRESADRVPSRLDGSDDSWPSAQSQSRCGQGVPRPAPSGRTRPQIHATPLARCERTGSGIAIGIAHVPRQRNPPAITNQRARSSRVDRALDVLIATVIGSCIAVWLFSWWSS